MHRCLAYSCEPAPFPPGLMSPENSQRVRKMLHGVPLVPKASAVTVLSSNRPLRASGWAPLAEFLGGTGSLSEFGFEAVGTDCPGTGRVGAGDDAVDGSSKLLLVGRRVRSIQPFGTDFRESHWRVFCHLCCLRYSICTCERLGLLFRLHPHLGRRGTGV